MLTAFDYVKNTIDVLLHVYPSPDALNIAINNNTPDIRVAVLLLREVGAQDSHWSKVLLPYLLDPGEVETVATIERLKSLIKSNIRFTIPINHETNLFYTGIGSRKIELPFFSLGKRIAQRLSQLGYQLRSGEAIGMDEAFESGHDNGKKEIYLPNPGFNEYDGGITFISDTAKTIAALLHPMGRKLLTIKTKKVSKILNLMARKTHQVLGGDCQTPSSFVCCATPDGAECFLDTTKDTGGTGQAIRLASLMGVPVFNLRNEDALKRLAPIIEQRKKFLSLPISRP